jgi:hypothetical protein
VLGALAAFVLVDAWAPPTTPSPCEYKGCLQAVLNEAFVWQAAIGSGLLMYCCTCTALSALLATVGVTIL